MPFLMRYCIRCFVVLAGLSVLPGATAIAQTSTFKAVMSADLKVLDPHFDSTNITRIYANAVFDTLLAEDAQGQIRPQMADSWQESADHLVWEFTLRDHLMFHDGTPVTAEDCIASLRRWAPRDAMGRLLAARVEAWEPIDARRFRIRLKQPFPLMLETLGAPRNPMAAIMPARLAAIPVDQRITDPIGSGPFMFVRSEWVSGVKSVMVRNPAYVPRAEPASGLAGGKVAKVDRIEWLVIPDGSTATNALIKGEVDYLEAPDFDSLPLLRSAQDVQVVVPEAKLAHRVNIIRPNSGGGVFADSDIRRVLWQAINTEDMPVAMGVPDGMYVKGCRSIYGCGGPYETDAGLNEQPAASPEAARAALKKTRYAGQPVVILQGRDAPDSNMGSEVLASALQAAGFTVDMQAVDLGTLLARRMHNEGWDLWTYSAAGWDMAVPITNFYLAGTCTAFPGNHCDPILKSLLEGFVNAPSQTERRRIADEIQRETFQSTPYVFAGQYRQPRAVRRSIRGMDHSLIFPVFWGIERP